MIERAYDCIQLRYTTQHRTVLNSSASYPPDIKSSQLRFLICHNSSDVVYWTDNTSDKSLTQTGCSNSIGI